MDILNTIADGFDPDALDKLKIDSQERLAIVETPMPTGPAPQFAPVPQYQPVIPKTYSPNDLMFKQRNEVKLEDLINSDDPEKVRMGMQLSLQKAAQSPAVKYNWSDRIYRPNQLMRDMEADGYRYDLNLSPAQNEEKARQLDKASHWGITNVALTAGKTIGRTAALVPTKLGTMVAQAGAAINHMIGGDDAKDFVTAVADNVYVRELQNSEEDIKQNFLKTYREMNYDNLGFFEKFGHSQFWTDEVADTVAFQVAAYMTGRAIGGALGGGVLGRPLGANTTAGNLLNKGLRTLTGANNIGGIAAWAVNVNNEALIEATQAYQQVRDDLKAQTDPNTGQPYSPEEVQRRAAEAGAFVYRGNLGVLMFSNGLENRWIQRGLGKDIARKGAGIVLTETGEAAAKQFSNKALRWLDSNGVGKRLIYYGPEVVEGILKEGYWEENAQTALTRLADQKFGKGYYDRVNQEGATKEKITPTGSNFMDFIKQLGKQTADASSWFGGKGDNEVATSIGLGGLIAVGGTALSTRGQREWDPETGESKFRFFKSERKAQEEQRLKSIKEINDARDTFISFKDIYNQDGSIDAVKLREKGAKLAEVAMKFDLSENVTDPIVKDQLQKSIFSDYVLAHITNGTFDQFKERFSGPKDENVLATMGFSSQTVDNVGEYIQLMDDLRSSYNSIASIQRPIGELNPREFEYYNSLLNRRLYELNSRYFLNASTIDKISNRIQEDYGALAPVNEYDTLYREYQATKSQKDTDGTLSTRLDIIRDRLSSIEDTISQLFEDHGEPFRNDVKSYENAKAYQDRIIQDIANYSSPMKGLERYIQDYKNAVGPIIDVPVVERTTPEQEAQSEEEDVVTENPPQPPAPPPAMEELKQGFTRATDLKPGDIIDDQGNDKTIKSVDLNPDGSVKTINFSDGTNAPNQGKNPFSLQYKIRTAPVDVEKNFLDSLRDPDVTKEALEKSYSSLPEETKKKHQTEYDKKLKSFDSDNGPVIQRVLGPRMAFNTPQKTDLAQTQDDPINEFVEILDSKEYLRFKAEIIPQLNEAYNYVLESDTYNIDNLPQEEFEKLKGEVLVVYHPDGTKVLVEDLSPDFYRRLHGKPVVFSVDNGHFVDRDFAERVKIYARENGKDETEAKKILNNLEKVKTEARRRIKLDPSLKIPVSFIRTSKGIEPTTRSKKKVNTIFKDVTIKNVTSSEEGFAIAEMSNGYKVKSFLPRLSNSTISKKINDLIKKRYTSDEDLANAIRYIKTFVYDKNLTIFGLDGKVVIEQNGKQIKALPETTLMTMRKDLLLNGFLDENGNPIDATGYQDLIKENLETNYKVIIDKKGNQYFNPVNPYLEFDISLDTLPVEQKPTQASPEDAIEARRQEELEKAKREWMADVNEQGHPNRAWPPIQKEINDRYDAELAALSPVIEVTPTQTTPFVEKEKPSVKSVLGTIKPVDVVTGEKQVEIAAKDVLPFTFNGKSYVFNKETGAIEINGFPVPDETPAAILEALYQAHPFDENNKENTIYKKVIPLQTGKYTFYSGFAPMGGEFIDFGGMLVFYPNLDEILRDKDEITPMAKVIIQKIKNRYC